MTIDTLETVWAPRLLSVLRIVAALLFLEHGSSKLFSFPPSDHSGAEFLTLPWFAGVLELVGGALLVPGIFTRCVAFILSGEMAVGYWMVHAPKSFYPSSMAGMLRFFIASYSSVLQPRAADPGASMLCGGKKPEPLTPRLAEMPVFPGPKWLCLLPRLQNSRQIIREFEFALLMGTQAPNSLKGRGIKPNQ